jgi:hypothetical protein
MTPFAHSLHTDCPSWSWKNPAPQGLGATRFGHSNPEGQGVVLLVDAGGQKIPAPHGKQVAGS